MAAVIEVTDNDTFDGERSFTLELMATSGPDTPLYVSLGMAVVVIEDDDCPSGEVSVCVRGGRVSE